MIPIRNSTKDVLIEVDLEQGVFVKCYNCGHSMNEEETKPFMHDACWDSTSTEIHYMARQDLAYALRHKLAAIPKGIGFGSGRII
jgi:hypothetical protein